MKPHIKLKTPYGTIAPTAEQLSSQIAVLSRFPPVFQRFQRLAA